MHRKQPALSALSLAQQNYVETIDELAREAGYARTTELAARLRVSMPSVSEAVSRLAAAGIVTRRTRSQIVLSAGGRRLAAQLAGRHRALKRFMIEVMAMAPARADALACRMEHDIDREFAARLVRFADVLERRHPAALADAGAALRAGWRRGAGAAGAGRKA